MGQMFTAFDTRLRRHEELAHGQLITMSPEQASTPPTPLRVLNGGGQSVATDAAGRAPRLRLIQGGSLASGLRVEANRVSP